MRPTEVRGLPWIDVDWSNKCLHLTQDADEFCQIGQLKSAAAYRTIPLPDFVMSMLEHWKEICPAGDGDLVFPNWAGKVESHSNIYRRGWYVLCREAGFVEIGEDGKERAKYPLNTLRHLKATFEITLERPPKRIQELLGHEDITLTFDTYGHLFKSDTLKDDPNDMLNLIKSGGATDTNGCQMGAA